MVINDRTKEIYSRIGQIEFSLHCGDMSQWIEEDLYHEHEALQDELYEINKGQYEACVVDPF